MNVDSILREQIIKLALLQHHKPYIHYAQGSSSFDCSGLVWFVYKELCGIDLYDSGYGLSMTTKMMTCHYGTITVFEENRINKNLGLIQKGDIVFFHEQSLKENKPSIHNKYPGHCGIYLGQENFIHASKYKGKVVISNFSKNEYWKSVLVASRDILSDEKVFTKISK